MLSVVGIATGALVMIVGGIWLSFNLMFRGMISAETKLMKREGKFEGEPDYMKDFRVARSEGELEENRRDKYRAILMFFIGMLIIIITLLARLG